MTPIVANGIITANESLTADYRRMSFDLPAIARLAAPGSFVGVAIPHDATLRRPFAIMDANETEIAIVFKIVGNGTRTLAAARVGDSISILGPLGRPFTVARETESAALVGGGVGVPPLFALARALHANGTRVTVYLGARTRNDVLLEDAFAPYADVVIATDDGSYGRHGVVVDALRASYENGTRIYACGPRGMLAAVQAFAKERDAWAELSLEARMGCGFGACLGCAIATVDGYKLCCTDGPVFDARNVVFA